MNKTMDTVFPQFLEWVDRYGVAVQEYPHYFQHTSHPRQVNLLLLSFIVEGRARHRITDAEFHAGPGSVGITRYGENHMLVTDSGSIRVYNIYLDPRRHHLPLVPGELRRLQLLLFPENESFRHQLNRSMHFQLQDPQAFLSVVQYLDREIQNPGPGGEEMVRALLKVLVISCCRSAQVSGIHPAVSKGRDIPFWIRELCRHMDHHFAEDISLDDLCGLVGRTRSYLCRSFKHHVGVTAGEYILQRRLEFASLALQGGNEKILSVALDCGFNDLSYFNRLFKARMGVTPSAYRAGQRD